ncbi:unnamed protein product [Peronospora belbahrii]|uniref:CID domain-containing protein n=1 Tax=Peronospora belbahrii TaxID=622444 RepID=A0AAU9KK90_9STRA|nr:unnamed protein product [Peronospora belbahrii]CAH0513370.1 unnamed protein product [Peronospora belbahrii]
MYSREKLERLLRQTKVTTQSIQKVSQWMLNHRQNLEDMVTLWDNLIREGEAEHQIVYLYVANDAMQVGVRKFGRHIAAAFEEKLVDIVQLVMKNGEEKVKRCAIKIVGIWKERGVVTPSLLAMLENVCAGKPAIEKVPKADMKTEEKTAKLLQEMTSDTTVERLLEDMPDVAEAGATTQLGAHVQDLVNATISADMLSDRMFQLESSISVFHHACAEMDEKEDDEVVIVADENESTFPTAGGIAWSKLDQHVYDLDVDNSRGHVEQYRKNLMDQTAKREALISNLRGLENSDLFIFPQVATTEEEADQQERALERLYIAACEAETLEQKQLEEQRAEFRARQAALAASASDPLYSGYQAAEDLYRPVAPTILMRGRSDSGNSYVGYRRSSHQDDQLHRPSPAHRRHSSASATTDRGFNHDQHHFGGQHDQYNGQDARNGGQNDRYNVALPSTSKRPKLHHSHSMELQHMQWQDISRHSPPQGRISPNSYTAVGRDNLTYSPRNNRYSPRDHYQVPPQPRHGRRTRWDSMPEERYSNDYNDRRW